MGQPPYEVENTQDLGKVIAKADLTFSSPFWIERPDLRDLVSKLLDKDPVKRMSCEEALKHPWFK